MMNSTGSDSHLNAPIRLCYHRGVHYNSIIDPHKATIGVGLGLPGMIPGAADRNLLTQAYRASEDVLVERTMLEDKIKATGNFSFLKNGNSLKHVSLNDVTLLRTERVNYLVTKVPLLPLKNWGQRDQNMRYDTVKN